MALGNCSWLPKRKLAGKPDFKLPVHETPPARPPSTQKEEVCASIDHQNVSETALLPHGLDWTVGQSECSWTMVMWRLFFFFGFKGSRSINPSFYFTDSGVAERVFHLGDTCPNHPVV